MNGKAASSGGKQSYLIIRTIVITFHPECHDGRGSVSRHFPAFIPAFTFKREVNPLTPFFCGKPDERMNTRETCVTQELL